MILRNKHIKLRNKQDHKCHYTIDINFYYLLFIYPKYLYNDIFYILWLWTFEIVSHVIYIIKYIGLLLSSLSAR